MTPLRRACRRSGQGEKSGHWGRKVRRDRLVIKDLKGRVVVKARRDRRGRRGSVADKVHQAPKATKEVQALQGIQAHKVSPEHKVTPVRKDLLVRKAHRAHRGRKASPVPREHKGLPDHPASCECAMTAHLLRARS